MNKYIIEIKVFGNTCWNFEFDSDHISRYFDNDFYEYSCSDVKEHKYKLRRVFDNMNQVVNYLDSIKSHIYSKYTVTYEYVNNGVIGFIDKAISVIKNGDMFFHASSYAGIAITYKCFETDIKQIKEIIYY